MFKTSFGMYSPVDFETYKKIKKIKAAINVSQLKAARFYKWQKKMPHNRKSPEPKVCDLFFDKKEKQGYHFGSWDKTLRAYERIYYTTEYYTISDLAKDYRILWNQIKYVRVNPDDLPDITIPDNLDDIYEKSKEYVDNYSSKQKV
tara:strand:+ start:1867 stop:2304 length:438 start_codon:yes stop_codon:yes gene_type:complete